MKSISKEIPMSTRSMRRILTGLATALVLAGSTTGGLADVAQAAGPEVQIVALHNQDCLMTRNWQHASQIVTRRCNGELRQRWEIRDIDGNPDTHIYEIVNRFNDMCLDVTDASQSDWTKVVQAECWGGDNQHWQLASMDGYQKLVAGHSGKCLDISFGWAIQFECNGGSNQLFKFPPVT